MLRLISGLCCVAMVAANTPMQHQDTLKDVAERSLAAACDQTLGNTTFKYVSVTERERERESWLHARPHIY